MDSGMADDKRIYFYVRYRKFHGGHLKVRDYFDHVQALPGYQAGIVFSPRTTWDEANPWLDVREHAVNLNVAGAPDYHFVAGMRWDWMDQALGGEPAEPVLNLVQHVRHGDPRDPRYQYLSRPAIRICVSEEVAASVRNAGVANGPIVTIPNGIPALAMPQAPPVVDTDVTILAVKQPATGERLAAALRDQGRRVELVDGYLPRNAFLAQMRRARAVLCLPNPTEGFYLPALEAMTMGAIVVCPDCIGNRSFCIAGVTAIMPPYAEPDLVAGVDAALGLSAADATRLREAGTAIAAQHTLARERASFAGVLDGVHDLWRETSDADD